MVAIVRWISPSGKSFITLATSCHQGPQVMAGVSRAWTNAVNKYGPDAMTRQILWNKRNAPDHEVTRKFNEMVREYEPEYN